MMIYLKDMDGVIKMIKRFFKKTGLNVGDILILLALALFVFCNFAVNILFGLYSLSIILALFGVGYYIINRKG